MVIKCRRREYTVTNFDIVLDNGACQQLITQTYFKGWSRISPVLSKALFKSLLREDKLVLIMERESLKYYRFNV